MQPAFSTPFPEPLPAAMPQLSEKPRHGVQSWNPAPHPGQFVCNSRTAIGLQFGWSGIVSGTVVAPNNGYPGSSYTKLFCAGDALRANGASTALDAVGIIPGGGNLLHGIQLGAGVISAGISVFGEARDAALSAGGLGLAFADKAGASIALHGTELIPVAGNILSGVSTYYDVKALAATYKSCMAGGKYD